MSKGMYSVRKGDLDTNLDLTHLKPYGDTMNDGKVQLSFTLSVPDSEVAVEAARQLAMKMGLVEPTVTHHAPLDKSFSFFVVYGSVNHFIDYTQLHVDSVDIDVMTLEEADLFIQQNLGRKIKVIGASTGTDAHTVGIDAILNMKGYAGHYGLERYKMMEVLNLGSQVSNEDFIRKAVDFDADVMLVSQTVTQKNIHIQNLTELVELLEAEHLRKRFLLIIGGPRINHELAKELGCDAGFGPGKYADDVASFICEEMAARKRQN